MAEVESRDNLAKESTSLFGCQSSLLHEVVKELAARDMLQNEVPDGTHQNITSHVN